MVNIGLFGTIVCWLVGYRLSGLWILGFWVPWICWVLGFPGFVGFLGFVVNLDFIGCWGLV